MQSVLVIAILLVATLGAGGLYPGIFPVCAIAAVAGLFVAMPVRHRANRLFWLAGVATLAWVFFTAVPLPATWLATFNPTRAHYFARADQATVQLRALHDLQAAATDTPLSPSAEKNMAALPDTLLPAAPEEDAGHAALQGDKTHCLSLNRDGTLRFFLLAAGCWGLFWMAAGLGHVARRRLLKVLVCLGAIVALVGIAGRGSSWAAQLLPRQTLEEFGVTSSIWPFINRNHFATFSALLAPAALCLLLSPSLGVWARLPQGGAPVLPKWHTPASGLERVIYTLAFAILVVATLLSESRAGMLALILALLLTILYWLKGRQLAASTVATILGIGVLFTVVFLPSESFQQRMATLNVSQLHLNDDRLEVWQNGIAVWKELPVIGAGMDGFRTMDAMHKTTPSVSSPMYAHNEYIQLLADGGVVGFLIFILLGAAYLWGFAAHRLAPEQYGPESGDKSWGEEKLHIRPLKAAVLGAGAVLLLHSFFDFPCRIPLNAFLAATLLGFGLSQRGTMPSHGPESAAPSAWKYTALAIAVLLLGASLYTANEIGNRNLQHDYVPHLQQASMPELAAAIETTPSYWVGWHEMGRRSFDIAEGRISPAEAFPPREPRHPGWLRQQIDSWRRQPVPLEAVPADTDALEAFNVIPPLKNGKGKPATPLTDKLAALPPDPLVSTEPALDAAGTLFQDGSHAPPPLSKKSWLDFGLDCFRQAAAYNPDDYRVWFSLGKAEGTAGNLDKAQDAFARMIELAPDMKPEADKAMRYFTDAAKAEAP